MSKHCKTCTNANTPICNSCSFIENSKGQSTPNQYVGRPTYAEVTELTIKKDDIRAILQDRLGFSREIPLHWVIEYNKYLEAIHNYYGTE